MQLRLAYDETSRRAVSLDSKAALPALALDHDGYQLRSSGRESYTTLRKAISLECRSAMIPSRIGKCHQAIRCRCVGCRAIELTGAVRLHDQPQDVRHVPHRRDDRSHVRSRSAVRADVAGTDQRSKTTCLSRSQATSSTWACRPTARPASSSRTSTRMASRSSVRRIVSMRC